MKFVDYSVIRQNAIYFKKILKNAKLCAVVKNDAYGHGLVPTVTALSDVADCFAVGNAADAVTIKPFAQDIMILLPLNYQDTLTAINVGAILTVDSFATLNTVAQAAIESDVEPRVHIKIDSGMSRLGFVEQQLYELCGAIDGLKIRVEGVFSHFYGDTRLQCDKQYEYFTKCADIIEEHVKHKLTRHIANTSATLLDAKYHLDLARVGLGLYGYGNDALKPAATVTANVISSKAVKKGRVVGYGAKYICRCDTNLAVLDIGYAHGLSRTAVGSYVNIGGELYPIAAICMAMTIIDTADKQLDVGQTAILLGNDVNLSNNLLIVYELLCNLR